MPKLSQIIFAIEEFAPLSLQLDYDNCGLKLGDPNTEISGILVTLDTNLSVVEEAIKHKCNLIIEHHPSIWNGLKSFDNTLPLNRGLIAALKNDIAIYSSHTNIDMAIGGLNDTVAELIGLIDIEPCQDLSSPRVGYIGSDIPNTLGSYAEYVGKILGDKNILTIGDINKKINKVAVVNGAGGDSDTVIKTFNEGCDVFITGDIKYAVARLAKDLDYAIIQFGHYNSELPFLGLVTKIISAKFKDLAVYEAKTLSNPFNER